MTRNRLTALVLVVATTLCCTGPANAADPKADEYPEPLKTAPALPGEFAFVFSLPYGLGDEFPLEPEEFERMLVLLKGAGFNTVHCVYKDWRHELFKKHKMKMMVDVLAWKPPSETDIRRNEEQQARVKQNCIASRGSEAIWGYNLWNERLDWCGGFENLDLWLRMLRTWDPTHPVWVGTYRYLYCEHFPTHPGVHGYYDYHWARGMGWHFKNLSFYRGIVEKRRSVIGRWLLMTDYNRNMYTFNTSIPYGLKTCIWFIGGPYANREPDKSKRWIEDQHLVRIGRHMQPLYGLIGEMGRPVAVYSTPTRRDPANHDKPEGLPGDTTAFPDDHWLEVKQGEVLCGFFKLPDASDVVWVANHNAYAWQGVVMGIRQDEKNALVVSEFDRPSGDWVELGPLDEVNFALPPADARVFRFQRVKPGSKTVPSTADQQKQAQNYNPSSHFARVAKLLQDQNALADKGGRPDAVYSTPTLRTADNRDKSPGLPPATKPFPDDFWLAVKQGEVLCGFFKLTDGSEAVCLANHNALAWQGGLIVPRQDKDNPTMIWELDQANGQWAELGTWGDVNFPLAPAASAVFKFKPAKPSP